MSNYCFSYGLQRNTLLGDTGVASWVHGGAKRYSKGATGSDGGEQSKKKGSDGEDGLDPFKDMPEELRELAKDFKPDLAGYRDYIKQKQAEGSAIHKAMDQPQEWYRRLAQSPEMGFVILMSIIASLSWNLIRRKKDLQEWEHERKMREAALTERIAVLEQSLAAMQEHGGPQPLSSDGSEASADSNAQSAPVRAGGRIIL